MPIDLEKEIEQTEEFPIEVDTLEEFIQSYYALLDSDDYLKSFDFLKHEKNSIPSSDKYLKNFLVKLLELRSGLRKQVTIFQFGDSHIKPGFFSTTARSSLIKYFGAAQDGYSPTLNYQFMGVNGGSFQNLLGNEQLFNRCQELQPDLVVVSLGTNDSQGTYNAQRFRKELSTFMEKMKGYQGSANVVFTLPPDTNKRGKHNADVAKVSDEIIDYAKDNGYAWWNLGEVMGGKNSIAKWRAQDLASQDFLHFSPKGYMLQGYLFYSAIMRAYKMYTEKNK